MAQEQQQQRRQPEQLEQCLTSRAEDELFSAWCMDNACEQTVSSKDKFCSNIHDKCKDKQVSLRRCRVGELTAQTLCRVFKYAFIVKLDLSDNPIKDSAVESLVQIFKSQLVIRRLILKNCRLTSTSGILIARAIKDGLPLHVLDIGNTIIDANANVFNGVVGAAFAGAIIASPTLHELGLHSTQLCTNIKGRRDEKFEAAICLMEAMRASKVIQKLWLGCNGFGKDGGPIILNAICESRSLLAFDVSGNDMDSSVSLVLQSAVAACASLQHLSLSDNKIGHVAAAALARGISSSRFISRLELARCCIGDKGARVLLDCISSFGVPLEYLDLTDNELTADSADRVKVMLSSGACSVTVLLLSNNRIGNDGLQNIMGAVCSEGCKLQKLCVKRAGISDAGVLHCSAMLISMGKSSPLTHWDIGNNVVSDTSAIALCELLQSVSTITCIEVQGNSISHLLQARIIKLGEDNRNDLRLREPRKLAEQIRELEVFEKRLKEVEFQLARVQANKANAISRLGEETAACDKAIELFNTNEMQQNQAIQERQTAVDALNSKLSESKLAKEALDAQLVEELAEIERRTALAIEERKTAAEMLVAKSRQLEHPMDIVAKREELQEELDELLVKVSAEKIVYEQTMSSLKAAEEASAALQKKCADADAMLEKKTQQVEAAKKVAKAAPAKKK